MNKFKMITALVAFIFASIFFTGCVEKPVYVTDVSFKEGCPTEVLINDLDLSQFTLVVTYSNGTEQEVAVTDQMVDNASYLNIIKREGPQTLTISYLGYDLQWDVEVKRYTFDNVFINDQTIVYDGEYHSLEVEGLIPLNTTIEYVDRNRYMNNGDYTVTAIISNELYVSKTLTGTLHILKADYDISQISFEDVTYTYDGLEKAITVSGVPEEVKVVYKIGEEVTNKKTSAGIYTVTAYFEPALNYNEIKKTDGTPWQAKLIINKADYDMTGYNFYDKSVYYTGSTHEMHITNEASLPYGVNVSYTGLDAVNAGEYTITANFTGNPNYNDIPSMSAKLIIKQAIVGLTGVYLDSQSIVYDGKEHSIEYQGTKPNSILHTGYTIYNQQGDLIYDSNSSDLSLKHKPINAGTYTVYAHFSYRDSKNYSPIEPLQAILEIRKADITSIVIENEIKEYIENMGQSLTVTCPIEGVIAMPDIANPVEPGDYSITYTFSLYGDAAINYNVPEPITKTLSIVKKSISARITSTRIETVYDDTYKTIDLYLSEEESEWIQPYYFTLDSNSVKHPFTGAKLPGTYLVFVEYIIDEAKAPVNYSNYYYIPTRDSAYLIIKKKSIEIDDTMLTAQTLIYDEAKSQSVTLSSIDALLEKNPGINAENVKVKYVNNINTNIGYYCGQVIVTLDGDATKLYNPTTSYSFYYAIGTGTKGYNIYPEVVQKTFDYDGTSHGIILSELPQGISYEFDDTNTLTMPGTKALRIALVFDNEVAEWFYNLPYVQDRDLTGRPVISAVLTIAKIDYVPEFDLQDYVYQKDSPNRGVIVKKLVDGVNTEFFYEDEERVNVGTYKLYAKTTVTNTELLKIYKSISYINLEFKITKAEYKFSYSGLNVKYDGNEHYIQINGLEDEIEAGLIEYTTNDANGNPTDGKIEMGKYNVVIRFTNHSPNYKDLSAQSVILVIESTQVDCTDLINYSTNGGFITVNQFGTIYNLFNSIVNPKAFSFAYRVTYYSDSETAKDPTDPLFNYSGTTEDFIFNDFTDNEEFALIEFNATLNKGFVDQNGIITNSYHGYFRVKVNGLEKLNIDPVINNLRSGKINQGSSLESLGLSLISNLVTYSYTCQYYNGTDIYNETDYPDAYGSSTNAPYVFKYSTYDERFVRITLNFDCPDGTFIFDGIHSVQSYSKSFDVVVTPTTSIDDTEVIDHFTEPLEINQYSKIARYVQSYYDTSNVDYKVTIYENNQVVSENVTDYQFKNRDSNYSVKLTLTAKNNMKFDSNNQNSVDINFNVTLNPVNVINMSSFIAALNTSATELDMYLSYRDMIFDGLNMPDGVYYECIVKLNDKQVNRFQYNEMNNGDLFINTFDQTSLNKYKLCFRFYPAQDGYMFTDDGYELMKDSWEVERDLTIKYVRVIDYSPIETELAKLSSASIFNQYTSLSDYVPNLASLISTNNLTVTYDIKYYKDTNYTPVTIPADSTLTDYIFNTSIRNGASASTKVGIKFNFTFETASNAAFNQYVTDHNTRCVRTFSCDLTYKEYQIDITLNDAINWASLGDLNIYQYNELNNYLYLLGVPSSRIVSSEVNLINRTTKEAVASGDYHDHMTVGNAELYYFNTISSDTNMYKVDVTISFNDGYTILKNGRYQSNYILTYYLIVSPNVDTYDVSCLTSFTFGTYYQYDIVENNIKLMTDTYVTPYKWKIYLKSNSSGNICDTVYEGNINGNTRLSNVYANWGSGYQVYLDVTYNCSYGKQFISGSTLLNTTTYTQTYQVTLTPTVTIDTYRFDRFVNNSKQCLQALKTADLFVTVGLDSSQVTVSNLHINNSASEITPANYTFGKFTKYTLSYTLTCADGYCFGVGSGNVPQKSKAITFSKMAFMPSNYNYLSLLKAYCQKGFTFSVSGDTYYQPFSTMTWDTQSNVNIVYTARSITNMVYDGYTALKDITLYHTTSGTGYMKANNNTYHISFVMKYSGSYGGALKFTDDEVLYLEYDSELDLRDYIVVYLAD